MAWFASMSTSLCVQEERRIDFGGHIESLYQWVTIFLRPFKSKDIYGRMHSVLLTDEMLYTITSQT